MQFSEIIGQDATKNKLVELVRSSRLPHAMLLSGNLGYGTLPLATALAQYIMCENPSDTDSCGQCSSCLKMKNLQHPDLLLSFPVVSQKGPSTSVDFYPEFLDFIAENPYGDINGWLSHIDADKKMANITALESRRIIDRLALKNIEAKYKILIMWLPEYLGKEGNILLKQIEEPTPNTIMIFVSPQPQLLLSTIKSRVQEVKIPPIDKQDIAEALVEKESVNSDQASMTANLAHGSWSEALTLSHREGDPFLDLFKSWLNVLFTHRIDLQIEWVEEVKKLPKNQILLFLDFLNRILREFVIFLYTEDKKGLSPEYAEIFPRLAEKINDLSVIEKMQESIQDVTYAIRRNAQVDLALHSLCINNEYITNYYQFK